MRAPERDLTLRIRRAWGQAGRLLLATDLDGTLSARADGGRRTSTGAARALSRLSERLDAEVLVLSDRDLEDVLQRLPVAPTVHVIAENGRIIRTRDLGVIEQILAPRQAAALEVVERGAAAELPPGVAVARTEGSISIDLGVSLERSDPELQRGVARLGAAARELGLAWRETATGVTVTARVPAKLAAVRRASEHDPEAVAFVYAGDDATDREAIELAASLPLGVGVHVASGEPWRGDPRVAVAEREAAWAGVLTRVAREGPAA